jgi:hypothetical protein
VANAVGENAMNPIIIGRILSVLAILLTPTVSATYHFDKYDIQQRVIREAKRQNIDPSLALAIAEVESNFNYQAISHAGAKGVMQIMPETAEQVFGVSRRRLFDPNVNIELGVKFIKKLLKRYDGRLDIALSHYNGGSGVKNRHGNLSVMPATRDYVDKVLATQQSFLQHDNVSTLGNDLQHDNQPLLTSLIEQSGINYVRADTGKTQADQKIFETSSEDPQIEALRALRLHNITRNYKGKSALSFSQQPARLEKSPSVQLTRNKKIEKVRQWESIYAD